MASELKLPLHRWASGLRRAVGMSGTPVRNTFVHYDDVVDEEEESDAPRKCVSNLLDGMPMRWKFDDTLLGHIHGIISSYRTSCSSKRRAVSGPPTEDISCFVDVSVKAPAADELKASLAVSDASTAPDRYCPAPVLGKDRRDANAVARVLDAQALTLEVVLPSAGGVEAVLCADVERPTPETPSGKAAWSTGAAGHDWGQCKPCAWNWKPAGCSKGETCDYCHLCDETAMKRKQVHKTERKKLYRRRNTA